MGVENWQNQITAQKELLFIKFFEDGFKPIRMERTLKLLTSIAEIALLN